MAIGVIFTELDLDTSKFVAKQKKLQDDVKKVGTDIDLSLQRSFQNLAVQSDQIYQLMANKAIKSYERISQAAEKSVAEQFRAQSAMVAKINSLNAEMTKNPLYETLGIRSQAAIEAQKQAIILSYETIKNSGQITATDLINIEVAKNAKILALDNELNAVKIANDVKEVASAKLVADAIIAQQTKLRAQGLMQVEATAMDIKRTRDLQEASAARYITEIEWQKKMEATKSEAWEENAKRTRAQGLMQIEAAKEDIERTKAVQEQKIRDANQHYSTLGMKSAADIKQRIADVNAAAITQQAIVGKSSDDWIRIEHAKNAKLKELNNEMVGQHEMSVAAMMRSVLRLYAVYFVVSSAARALFVPFEKGFEAVESYNQSVASLAAMVVTFSEAKPGQSLSAQWKEALSYSTAMVPVLEKIAARTLLSGEATTALANAFARSGVFLQANNAAQIEGFTRISNALPLMTKGQEIMRQINTEIRSVMTGQNEQSSMMLQTLKALPGFSKENLEIWRQQGIVMENVGKLLEGFGPATKLLENQWEAVKTTLETTVTQILRGGMLGAYGELILSAKDLDAWLNKNKDSFIESMSKWVGNFLLTMYTVKAEVLRLSMLLDKMGGTMTSAKMLLYGPGAAMGVESSKRRFGAAAEENINYENRYKENEKELEQLAIRYNNLEQSISAAGLAAAKLARESEAANQKFKAKPGIDEKAIKKVEDIEKQITEQIRRDHLEREQIGKSAYEKEILQIESQAKKYRAEIGQNKKIDEWEIESKKTALAKFNEWYEKENEKAAVALYKADKKAQGEKDKLTREQFLERRKEDEKYLASQIEIEKTIQEWKVKGIEADRKTDEERERIQEKFYQMMKAEESHDTDRSEQAIKRVINIERHKLEIIEEWQRKGLISFKQSEEAKRKITENSTKESAKLYSKEYEKENSDRQQAFSIVSRNFADMASLYAEDSRERQTLSNISKAATIAEIALQVEKNLMIAIGAVVNQGTGDPYSAFARMAAMTSVVAGVLAIGGIGFGGGGGGGGAMSYAPAYGQNTTVLGGANNQGSESISKSYELLEDTYKLEYRELTGIHNSMKELNRNITGIVSGIVRSSANGTPFGAEFGEFRGGGILGDLADKLYEYNPIIAWNKAIESIIGTNFISSTIDSVISKIGNFIFGSSEAIATASGISISGQGKVVRPYTSIHEESEGPFGIGKSSRDYTVMGAINQELSNLFGGPNGVFTNLTNTMVELSRSLGGDVNKALNYAFADISINLLGKDAEGINKAISETISNISDKMTQELLGPMIGSYQQINEGLLETAVRLMTNKEVILDTLEMTNQAFSGSTADVIAFSESIIAMAGDLDKLRTASESYYDKFFSDEEKHLRLQDQIIKSLAQVNLIMPAIREGYRNIVESLNLQTEAGQQQYVTMLKLAESADNYYSALEDVAQKQDEVTQSLKKQSDMVVQWLREINMNVAIAPVISSTAMVNEYNRLKGIVSGSGATEQDTSNFLSYAKEYLSYMRVYSNDYKSTYDKVIADMQGLSTTFEDKVVNAQLEAANALKDAAAQLSAAALSQMGAAQAVKQASIESAINNFNSSSWQSGMPSGEEVIANQSQFNASAGAIEQSAAWQRAYDYMTISTKQNSLAGTDLSIYDAYNKQWADQYAYAFANSNIPQYKDGLDYVPYDNYVAKLHKGERVLTNQERSRMDIGNAEEKEIHIHIHNETDGRELSEIVAKYIPRNGNLSAAVKKAAA